VWLPPDTAATYSPNYVFTLPVGTVLSKTFFYPRSTRDASLVVATEARGVDSAPPGLRLDEVRLVETRLLVHQGDGWVALAYVWNETQDDAVLEIVGARVPLAAELPDGSTGTIHYVVPTKNECTNCHAVDHTSRAIQPIGIAARHLDKTYDRYADGSAPQLSRWQKLGLLKDLPDQPVAKADAVWSPDARDDLEHRARTYLDINCGHCHSARGSADTSGLFLDRTETALRRLGACKPTVAAGRGTGGRQSVLVPGAPDASILTYRMETTDPGEMMPELGRTLMHGAGVELIRDWIETMSGECTPTMSANLEGSL
jgi:uncharacterized repeat protein (TIGR03806 family)